MQGSSSSSQDLPLRPLKQVRFLQSQSTEIVQHRSPPNFSCRLAALPNTSRRIRAVDVLQRYQVPTPPVLHGGPGSLDTTVSHARRTPPVHSHPTPTPLILNDGARGCDLTGSHPTPQVLHGGPGGRGPTDSKPKPMRALEVLSLFPKPEGPTTRQLRAINVLARFPPVPPAPQAGRLSIRIPSRQPPPTPPTIAAQDSDVDMDPSTPANDTDSDVEIVDYRRPPKSSTCSVAATNTDSSSDVEIVGYSRGLSPRPKSPTHWVNPTEYMLKARKPVRPWLGAVYPENYVVSREELHSSQVAQDRSLPGLMDDGGYPSFVISPGDVASLHQYLMARYPAVDDYDSYLDLLALFRNTNAIEAHNARNHYAELHAAAISIESARLALFHRLRERRTHS